MSLRGESMVQTKRVSVLTSAHDRRLNKLTVQDKSVMRKLNGNREKSALAD